MESTNTIRAELHHWWPQSLLRNWANDEGLISQVFTDGRIIKHKNTRNLAAVRNAHVIKLDKIPTVWDQSFESYFQEVDSAFPDLIKFIVGLPRKEKSQSLLLQDRLQECSVTDEQIEKLKDAMLSLIARGPKLRNSVENQTNYYQSRFNIPKPKVPDLLINLNLRNGYDTFKKNIIRGKYLVLFSLEKEFIFGDGFFNNFNEATNAPTSPKYLIPLLPNACVFYARPMSYTSHPRLMTALLNNEEVDYINRTTMIYSKDNVFYRNDSPDLIDDFKKNEYRQYEYDADYTLDHWINVFTQTRF